MPSEAGVKAGTSLRQVLVDVWERVKIGYTLEIDHDGEFLFHNVYKSDRDTESQVGQRTPD